MEHFLTDTVLRTKWYGNGDTVLRALRSKWYGNRDTVLRALRTKWYGSGDRSGSGLFWYVLGARCGLLKSLGLGV